MRMVPFVGRFQESWLWFGAGLRRILRFWFFLRRRRFPGQRIVQEKSFVARNKKAEPFYGSQKLQKGVL